jgi:hypothetical protein
MSFRTTLERIDADFFIPRPVDEPELDSFQAARRFFQDLSSCGTLLLSSSIAGYLFFRSGQMLGLDLKWLVFVLIGALLAAFVGVIESINLAYFVTFSNHIVDNDHDVWEGSAERCVKGSVTAWTSNWTGRIIR